MPFVDLVSSEDYASLWYYANTPGCNVGHFKPDRPTIVILHPFAMDSTWCFAQLDDPRLNNNYNIVIFDTRLTGKSVSKFNGKYDFWVAAADLAHAIYHLRLPAVHIFASEVFSLVALRFAILFPELCLSLTLCNVPPQQERETILQGLDDILQTWGYANDLESFEHANRDLLEFTSGKRLGKVSPLTSSSKRQRDTFVEALESLGHAEKHLASGEAEKMLDAELEDELVGYWQMNYPPFRRGRLANMIRTFCHDHRKPLTADELARIEAPVMILQAAKNELYPVRYAEALQESLVNARGGAKLQIVQGRVGYITIVRSSIVNQFLSKFLASLRSSKPECYQCPIVSLHDTMRHALQRLAAIRKDPSIARRNPSAPMSFSCCDDKTCAWHVELVKAYAAGQRKAFSPLGSDGRPLRKFSERKDHWLHDEDSFDGQDDARGKPFAESSTVWVAPPDKDDRNHSEVQRATITTTTTTTTTTSNGNVITSRRTESANVSSTAEKVSNRLQKNSVQKQLFRLLR